ncbi:MAG TPA: FAD-dependent oxidoreductase [Ramlibacter sp.]|nr:FAD-dependent oxidoreductase [Ramlibacter sp.]
MTTVRKVLVVGGGFSGTCAAIQLRKLGIAVDLVEIDPHWRTYGAGISISGATLRALGTVGVLPQFIEKGFCSDGVDLLTPTGMVVATMPTPRIAGPQVPGNAGILRSGLCRILAEATRASGTAVRLGVAPTSFTQEPDSVHVAFDDGTDGSYDLVVGADGLFSQTRRALLPDAPEPTYSGQGVWRALLPRPASVKRLSMYMGERTKIGFNPVSQEQMYMFVTEERAVNERVPDEQLVPRLQALLAPFPAQLVQDVRASLGPDSSIVYRPLEGLLMPLPWSQDRVVLIGDAVHATTPHLASGAGIGIEDAIVLAEEIGREGSMGEALKRFEGRRWERCRMVVENSRRLGEIEATGGSKEEHAHIMQSSMAALAMPI